MPQSNFAHEKNGKKQAKYKNIFQDYDNTCNYKGNQRRRPAGKKESTYELNALLRQQQIAAAAVIKQWHTL